MKTYTAVVERDRVTHLFVAYVPGFPGANTQAETLDEFQINLREVVGMLLDQQDDGHASRGKAFGEGEAETVGAAGDDGLRARIHDLDSMR